MGYRAFLQRQTGFSLVELLIYVTLSTAVMGSIYQTVRAQQKSYSSQNHLTEVQQNLSVATYILSKDIRSTAYNPTGRAAVGFVTKFAAPNDKFVIDYTTQNTMVALLTDTDGNGTVDANSTEQIAYRFNSTKKTLERFVSTATLPGGDWETVIDNVDAANFVFLGANGTVTTSPQNIRTVQIALLVRARKADPKFINTETYKNKQGQVLCTACANDHYQRRLLTTTVQARNCAYDGLQNLCVVPGLQS